MNTVVLTLLLASTNAAFTENVRCNAKTKAQNGQSGIADTSIWTKVAMTQADNSYNPTTGTAADCATAAKAVVTAADDATKTFCADYTPGDTTTDSTCLVFTGTTANQQAGVPTQVPITAFGGSAKAPSSAVYVGKSTTEAAWTAPAAEAKDKMTVGYGASTSTSHGWSVSESQREYDAVDTKYNLNTPYMCQRWCEEHIKSIAYFASKTGVCQFIQTYTWQDQNTGDGWGNCSFRVTTSQAVKDSKYDAAMKRTNGPLEVYYAAVYNGKATAEAPTVSQMDMKDDDKKDDDMKKKEDSSAYLAAGFSAALVASTLF